MTTAHQLDLKKSNGDRFIFTYMPGEETQVLDALGDRHGKESHRPQRHEHEAVIIGLPDGREIRVMTVDIRPDKVKLGFEAPEDVTVHRKEIADAIKRDRAEARP
jgi:carbon storage regulator